VVNALAIATGHGWVKATMRIRRQAWRFLFIVFAVVIGFLFGPAVQAGPHKLISYISRPHYACIFALMMFAALWIWDVLRWIESRFGSSTRRYWFAGFVGAAYGFVCFVIAWNLRLLQGFYTIRKLEPGKLIVFISDPAERWIFLLMFVVGGAGFSSLIMWRFALKKAQSLDPLEIERLRTQLKRLSGPQRDMLCELIQSGQASEAIQEVERILDITIRSPAFLAAEIRADKGSR
jgi:hypothetical protein